MVPLGHTRCYWTVMDCKMNFKYLDPVLQEHMGEQAPVMLTKNLVDFIHPEEKEAAEADFAKFRTGTTIFGSVTRCRYARVSYGRKMLGAEEADTPTNADGYCIDDKWASVRITASMIAENTVLTFYHLVRDLDEVADNDEANLSTWTNWCGPRGDIRREYLTPEQLQEMHAAFKSCQDESESLAEKVAKRKAEEGGEAPKQPIPPSYVFQILSSMDGSIVFTWPPPMPTGEEKDIDIHGPSIDNEQRYVPAEYAMLAKGVLARPRDKQSEEARTNCTKRYQSKHPINKQGVMTHIESVVVTYQAITFVCFQTGGVYLNAKGVGMVPQMQSAKRKSDEGQDLDVDEENMKRLRADDGGLNPNASAILGSFASHNPGDFPAMPSPMGQFNGDDKSLQTPYFNAQFPNMYSGMFGADGRPAFNAGMPTMPSPQGNTALQNLALASSASSFYSDYNANGQQNFAGGALDPNASQGMLNFIPRQRGENAADGQPAPAAPTETLHRVRKNDRNRVCTSCGTSNSPEWRKGPSGIKTLCNACGLRYSRAQARKAKKAQKEADALNAVANGSAPPSNATTPTTPYIPGPLLPGPSSAPVQGDSTSPYMGIPDYSNSPSSAALPPLPQSAGTGNGESGDTSTAGYSGYANYSYGNPYDNTNWASATSGYVPPPGGLEQQDPNQSGDGSQSNQEE